MRRNNTFQCVVSSLEIESTHKHPTRQKEVCPPPLPTTRALYRTRTPPCHERSAVLNYPPSVEVWFENRLFFSVSTMLQASLQQARYARSPSTVGTRVYSISQRMKQLGSLRAWGPYFPKALLRKRGRGLRVVREIFSFFLRTYIAPRFLNKTIY